MPKPRARPEFDTVCVPVKREMEKAGFKSAYLGKTVYNGRVFISAVPIGIPDFLFWHPERKVTVFVEVKAPGGKLRPEQRSFLQDHAGSETQAVCWSSVAECVTWLHREGLRSVTRDASTLKPIIHYPHGIHSPITQTDTYEEEWLS